MLKNMIKHFILVSRHKWEVLKLSIKAGIPIRGILHDLSKYSPTEFFGSIKYYTGNKSPICKEKLENGYSVVWLHHKGRNKHHPEYWYDNNTPVCTPIIPFKYVCEMICDQLSAGIVYQGKKWKKEYQLEYWNKQKQTILLNDKLKNMLDELYNQIAENGINKIITKTNLKKLYDTHTCN